MSSDAGMSDAGGVGEGTEQGTVLFLFRGKLTVEKNGVKLITKTVNTLMHIPTTLELDAEGVAGITVDDLTAEVNRIIDEEPGSITPMEKRRYDAWAGGKNVHMVSDNVHAIRSALTGSEGGGVVTEKDATFNLGTQLGRMEHEVVRIWPEMAGDAPAVRIVANICIGQGLKPMDVVCLSASIELGQVVGEHEVPEGKVRMDPRGLDFVKKIGKFAEMVWSKILARGDKREAVAHLTDLARDYALGHHPVEATLVSSFMTEADCAFKNDWPAMLRYFKTYFRTYPGQGIPTTFDDRMATRSRNEAREDAPPPSKAEMVAMVRSEMAAEMRRQGPGGGRQQPRQQPRVQQPRVKALTGAEAEVAAAKLAKVKCFNCQGKGHYARDCPEEQAVDGEAVDE